MNEIETSNASERKVVRRGLLAGLAGLGAAVLLKVTGADNARSAEAAGAALLYPAASGDSLQQNNSYNTTALFATSGFTSGGAVLRVDGSLAPNFAIGGLFYAGPFSSGVYAGGGSSSLAAVLPGDGLVAVGGTGSGGRAGRGVTATSTSSKGVYGQSTSSDGVHGTSTSGVGVRGTSPNFVGVVGISDNNIGLYGVTALPNMPALYAEHLGASGRIAAQFKGDVRIEGTLSATSKNAVVTMADGSEALLYCQESPEPYFEDFGRAQLTNGVARVQLEPEFASLVKREDYMVFTHPMGDSNGLYVSQQDANGFEVRESKGGKSTLLFTYRIVAKRKDIEGKRLARLDPKVKQNIAKMRSESAAKMPAAAMAGRIETPLVPHDPIVPIEVPKPSIDQRR